MVFHIDVAEECFRLTEDSRPLEVAEYSRKVRVWYDQCLRFVARQAVPHWQNQYKVDKQHVLLKKVPTGRCYAITLNRWIEHDAHQ